MQVILLSGCSENNGQRFGTNTEVCAQVHADEGQYPGCGPQDPDFEVPEHHGAGHAWSHACHGHHEPTTQHATDTEDPAGQYSNFLFIYLIIDEQLSAALMCL